MVEVNVDHLVELRTRAKEAFKAKHGVNLTYLPFVVRATVDALQTYPTVNARLDGDQIIFRARVTGRFLAPPLSVPGNPLGNIFSVGGPFTGTYEVIVALEDDIFENFCRRLASTFKVLTSSGRSLLPAWWARILRHRAQHSAERRHYRMRRATQRLQRQLDKSLGFAGYE